MNKTLVLATALLAVLAAACGTSDHPPASSSGGSVGPSIDGGGVSDASGSGDAGAVAVRPELCQGLTLGGTVAEEIAQAGPASVALGGSLVLGTYDLEGLDVYGAFDAGTPDGGDGTPGVQPTGRTAGSTLVVTKTALQIVEAFGTVGGSLGPPTSRAYAYVVKGAALSAAQQCPTAASTQPIGFTAAGDSLALFADANHRQVYRLRP